MFVLQPSVFATVQGWHENITIVSWYFHFFDIFDIFKISTFIISIC